MPRIPTYFRNKLVSSQTGPGSIDTSGAMIGEAIKTTAMNFFDEVAKMEQSRSQMLADTKMANVQSDFTTAYLERQQAIRQEFVNDPDGAVEALDVAAQELKDQQMEGLSSRLSSQAGAMLDTQIGKFQVENTVWKLKRENELALEDTFQALQKTVLSMRGQTDYAAYLNQVEAIEERRGSLTQLLGGDFQKADKLLENARTQTTTEYLYSLINAGDARTAFELINNPDKLTDLSEEDRTKLKKTAASAMRGQTRQREFRTAIQVLDENRQAVEQLKNQEMTFVEMDERAKNIDFELATEDLTDVQRQHKETQKRIFEALRDVELEALRFSATDDVDTIRGFDLRIEGILEPGKLELQDEKYVSDLLAMQEDLTAAHAAGKLSRDTYDEYMTDVLAAAQLSFDEEQTENTFFGLGPTKFSNVAKNYREAARSLYSRLRERDAFSQSYMVDALRFYIRDVKQAELDPNAIPQKEMLDRAVLKAFLKNNNLPLDLKVGDTVNTNAGLIRIDGQDEQGRPVSQVNPNSFFSAIQGTGGR